MVQAATAPGTLRRESWWDADGIHWAIVWRFDADAAQWLLILRYESEASS